MGRLRVEGRVCAEMDELSAERGEPSACRPVMRDLEVLREKPCVVKKFVERACICSNSGIEEARRATSSLKPREWILWGLDNVW